MQSPESTLISRWRGKESEILDGGILVSEGVKERDEMNEQNIGRGKEKRQKERKREEERGGRQKERKREREEGRGWRQKEREKTTLI